MGRVAEDIVERVKDVDLTRLQISPEEFFLLSRIDGPMSVGQLRSVQSAAGFTRAQTDTMIDRLAEVGALEVRAHQRTLQLGNQGLKEKAKQRKLLLLRAQMQVSRRDEGQREALIEAVSEQALQALTDPRVDPGLPIELEDQWAMLRWVDDVAAIDPFDLLGIEPTDDDKAIKRAFRAASRRLHPDAYHGRELGGFHPVLETLFKQLKSAYARMLDKGERTAYLEARRVRAEEAEEVKRALIQLGEARREEEQRKQIDDAREQLRAVETKRIRAELEATVRKHRRAAEKAHAEGDLDRAANLFRLALQADPDNEELRGLWESTRHAARKTRAFAAFKEAQSRTAGGKQNEAIAFYCDAADLEPSAKHLAHAAHACAVSDANRARDYALSALDALKRAVQQPDIRDADRRESGRLYLVVARAFVTMGQTASAKTAIAHAQTLLPDQREVAELQKQLKVS